MKGIQLTPCIEYRGKLTPAGYGRFRREGRRWFAHCWAAYQRYGPCPPGLETCHECDNKACINADHLRYDTRGSNNHDRKKNDRIYRKLNQAMADAIKGLRKDGYTRKSVAALYDISVTTVQKIDQGIYWA